MLPSHTEQVENENKEENGTAKLVNNLKILPGTYEMVKLKLDKNFKEQNVIFTPNKLKQNLNIENSLNTITTDNNFITIVENNSDEIIHLRKNQKIGKVQIFNKDEIETPSEKTVCQINNLSLEEVIKLRKNELTVQDFNLEHLNQKDKTDILNLLMNNYHIFSKSYATLGSTDKIVPDFKLLHNFPLVTKPYQIPRIAKKFAQTEIKKLLDAGIIEESTSSYSFPVIFVRKKNLDTDDPQKLKFRMVVDYRLLNSITETFQICLPKISDILHKIAGRKLYSVLDLKSAFFQIKLKKEDRKKLAFCTEFGNFQPTRLPFGAKNSVSYFHTLMSKCLQPIQGENIQYFLDDIIIAANNMEEMKFWLQKVFDRLKLFNLTLDPAKMQIAKTEITYLGFKLHKNGFSPSEQNIAKINKLTIPKNVKQVQMFLGTINYFRHLIYNFAELIQPIVNLTKKNTKFIWDTNCQQAFNKIQEILLQNPTLKNIDYNKTFYLITDASRSAISSIILQRQNNQFFPIKFFSKTLSQSERNYPSIRRELFAIYSSVKHFSDILTGRNFILLTDAKPLTFHLNLEKQPEIVARWLMYLQSFSYEAKHIEGKNNPADYLSRVIDDQNNYVNNITVFDTQNKLTKENILENQYKDINIIDIKNKMEENKDKTYSKFFIDSHTNLLMFKCKQTTRNKQIVNKIVIPKNLIKEVLIQAHTPHFGFKKTYEKVNKLYFWQGMYKDTLKFCKNCARCMEHKPKPNQTKFNFIEKSHLAPGEFIALDIVGKLPRSLDNKNFVLTILDHYSRFLEAIPLQNIKTYSIIKALENYFARFGIPKIILTDNGTNFKSEQFEKFLKTLNIQHRCSSIYYPQSNGAIERVHRIMKESIAAMSNKIFEWSERLLIFKLEYNNSKHTVTGFSPAQLFFGRNLNVPDEIFNNPMEVENYNDYFEKLKEHFKESKKLMRENEQKYFKNHEEFIKGRRKPNFELDDVVYVKNFANKQTFQRKYIGPFKIIRILKNDNYIIQSCEDDTGKTMKVHVSKIFLQQDMD